MWRFSAEEQTSVHLCRLMIIRILLSEPPKKLPVSFSQTVTSEIAYSRPHSLRTACNLDTQNFSMYLVCVCFWYK